MSDQLEHEYAEKIKALAGVTLCAIMTFGECGDVLIQYYGPVGVVTTNLIRAAAGSCVVEQLISMAELFPHLALSNGVIIAHGAADSDEETLR